MSNTFDAIVVGAGPGGATAAAFMARSGSRVLLLDKSAFPRDKICGDAIGGKAVATVRRLGLEDRLLESEHMPARSVVLGGPSGEVIRVPFSGSKALAEGSPPKRTAPGYIVRRTVFDNLIHQEAVASGAEFRGGIQIQDLIWEDSKAVGVLARTASSEQIEFRAPLIIGADGAYSAVARAVGAKQMVEKHYVAGVRAYYSNVTGFDQYASFEIHIIKEAIPGYFWIFPLPDGHANVGVGMLSSAIKKGNVSLKQLVDVLVNHPRFNERFADAKLEGPIKGWGLPLGSKPRKMAGPGWLLVGDAASLIDPATGEGIGNAMVSGRLAAEWAGKATAANDYTEPFLRGYQKSVLKALGTELRLSYLIQRIGSQQWLTNWVIKRAANSKTLEHAIISMFGEPDSEALKSVSSPTFYFRAAAALLGWKR